MTDHLAEVLRQRTAAAYDNTYLQGGHLGCAVQAPPHSCWLSDSSQLSLVRKFVVL
jgi:hypothetical protein